MVQPDTFAALSPPARAVLRAWALLSVGALAVAGGLALLLALARAPGTGTWLPWGADFFFRGLVTHVVFAFQIWFLAAFGAVLTLAVPSAADRGGLGPPLAASAGTALLLVPTLAGWGEPSLNNYVPVLDHPLFFAGLAAVGGGAGAAALRGVSRPRDWARGPAPFGMAMASLGLLAALACFVLAALLIPSDTDPALRDERLFWGGGHVLQFVNTLLLMAGWQTLSERAFGQGPLPPALARACFASLAVWCALAPLLYLRLDVLGLASRQAFTELLWWGLPLPPSLMGAGLAWRMLGRRLDWRSPAVLASALSLAVFALGGAAGFALGVGDTRTPSHYHAMIGGVNLVLMGLFHTVVLPALGRAPIPGPMVRWQFLLFGGGQLLHALGFYLAGAEGAPRKTFGAAQGLHGVGELAAMAVVGVGGAVAVAGGILFVAQTLRCLLRPGARHAP